MSLKIGLIGATGKLGATVLDQLVEGDADVTAIVQHPEKLTQQVTVLERNLFNLTKEDIKTFDVIISAFNAPNSDINQTITAMDHLIDSFNETDTRLIFAGSVGTLLTEDNVRVADTELIIPEFRERGKLSLTAFEHLAANTTFPWVYMAPPLFFDPAGQYTGNYELTGDALKLNDKGLSYVSYLDMSAAIIAEINTEDNHVLIGVHS